MVALTLDAVELRVLGSLIEKEITTPEYYPLTMNALVAACNQKSNREPVVAYDDDTVSAAVDSLARNGLAARISGAGSRVEKFAQRFSERLNLGRRELALLDALMLRGAQTAGELHARTARMHDFSDTDEIEGTLDRLIEWQPDPLVVRLPKVPGTREPRYMHLLGGPVDATAPEPETRAAAPPRDAEIAELREGIARLEEEMRVFRAEFAEFRKQFE